MDVSYCRALSIKNMEHLMNTHMHAWCSALVCRDHAQVHIFILGDYERSFMCSNVQKLFFHLPFVLTHCFSACVFKTPS